MSAKTKYVLGLLGLAASAYGALWAVAIIDAWDFSDMPKAIALIVLGVIGMAIDGAFSCND